MSFEETINSLQKDKTPLITTNRNKISYSAPIKCHRDKSLTDEEWVKAYIVTLLIYEYNYNPANIEIEYPVNAEVGSRSRKKYVDIVLKDNEGNIFYFIEVKTFPKWNSDREKTIKTQLFNLIPFVEPENPKYLVHASAEEIEKSISTKLEIISTEKYKNYTEWKNGGMIFETNNFSSAYEKPKKIPYKQSNNPLREDVSYQEFETIRTDLHNVLWGGGATTDTEVFNLLTRLILAKIEDEKTTPKTAEYNFQIKSSPDGTVESYEDTLTRINRLYQSIITSVLEGDSGEKVEGKVGQDKVMYAIQKIESINFTEMGNKPGAFDILGDFFEGIMRSGFKQSKGQFFTHKNIIKFMVYGLQLDNLAIRTINNETRIPKIIDPSAGAAAFLVESMKAISNTVKERRTDITSNPAIDDLIARNFEAGNRPNAWAEGHCYGLEINSDLGLAARTNMILHSDGSSTLFIGDKFGNGFSPFTLYKKDHSVLSNAKTREDYDKQVVETFDVVLSNPPFALTIPKEKREEYKNYFTLWEKASEILFIEKWFQLLKPLGRLGAVLPNSIFDSRVSTARDFLTKYFWIKAVISIPAEAFYPYTSTKTSLLFAQKKTDEEIQNTPDDSTCMLKQQGKVFYACANWLGYKRKAKKEIEINKNDLYGINQNGYIDPNIEGKILTKMRKEISWN